MEASYGAWVSIRGAPGGRIFRAWQATLGRMPRDRVEQGVSNILRKALTRIHAGERVFPPDLLEFVAACGVGKGSDTRIQAHRPYKALPVPRADPEKAAKELVHLRMLAGLRRQRGEDEGEGEGEENSPPASRSEPKGREVIPLAEEAVTKSISDTAEHSTAGFIRAPEKRS